VRRRGTVSRDHDRPRAVVLRHRLFQCSVEVIEIRFPCLLCDGHALQLQRVPELQEGVASPLRLSDKTSATSMTAKSTWLTTRPPVSPVRSIGR